MRFFIIFIVGKHVPMTGFEPWTYGVGSSRSTKLPCRSELLFSKLISFSKWTCAHCFCYSNHDFKKLCFAIYSFELKNKQTNTLIKTWLNAQSILRDLLLKVNSIKIHCSTNLVKWCNRNLLSSSWWSSGQRSRI